LTQRPAELLPSGRDLSTRAAAIRRCRGCRRSPPRRPPPCPEVPVEGARQSRLIAPRPTQRREVDVSPVHRAARANHGVGPVRPGWDARPGRLVRHRPPRSGLAVLTTHISPRGPRIGASGRATDGPQATTVAGAGGPPRADPSRVNRPPASHGAVPKRRMAAPGRPRSGSRCGGRLRASRAQRRWQRLHVYRLRQRSQPPLRYPGHHGMEEVRGSGPLSSTHYFPLSGLNRSSVISAVCGS
jgi:hypothetical protein